VHVPAHAFNAGSRFAGLKDRATRPSEVTEHIACRADGRDGLGEVLELAAGLPARWRYVVEQIYIQGRKYADVGQQLGVSKQRAQQIVGEAIGRLKRLLGVAAIAE
jgi:DNA-directed RNA polymerase specialized sigma subunit